MRFELDRFDPSVPVERAETPPSSWYVDPAFLELERRWVFAASWQAVARLDQLAHAGDFVAGDLVGEPWVVVRDPAGGLRAFYNVCRHHATCLVEGQGRIERFVCPYHGWTYDLAGRLRRAPRMGGVRDFDRQRHGLVPLDVAAHGPLVFLRAGPGPALAELLGPLGGRLRLDGLVFARRVRYEIDCNWKVFVDNYLDGGYHVEHLHRGLASQLDLGSYETEIHDRVSLQLCRAGAEGSAAEGEIAGRVAGGAAYAFVHPNLMLNRYGPILDTNWVVPLGPERTLTVFDYYFEPSRAGDAEFVERSLAASDRVQQEDIRVCESVQRGLRSSAFDRGRYAPTVEGAAHRFHCSLLEDLLRGAG